MIFTKARVTTGRRQYNSQGLIDSAFVHAIGKSLGVRCEARGLDTSRLVCKKSC